MQDDLPTWSDINCIHQSQIGNLQSMLARQSYHVIYFHGDEVTDKASFLVRAATDIPQPPDMISLDNWDALADNIWTDIANANQERVAILWLDSDVMIAGNLRDFFVALSCFQDLDRHCQEKGFGGGSSIAVFLLGNGSNYPRLPS